VRMPIFRGMKHWGKIIPVVLLSSLLFAACGGNSPTILSPTGPVASQEAGLFWFILSVATFIFVIVEGVLIWSIIRYRERPNSPAARQIHGNNTVEFIWTVVPSLFLFAVLAGTIYTMFGLQNIPSTNGSIPKINVRAVGHQWWWEFDYPNQHVVTADTLYIPQGSVVQMDLLSNNVIHSFWVPSITGKTDVIPGHNNQKIFRADVTGEYRGECAEYCGTQHAHMNFNVVVLNTNAFNTWLSNEQQAAVAPTDALALQGQKIFAGSCTGCHGIVGVDLNSFDATKTNSGLAASSLVGPNLTHFAERNLIAGGILMASDGHNWANDPACQLVNGQLADKNNCGLYQWLHDPQGVKPGNDMVIGSLSDTQIYALIAYLQGLK
jgi:cytochrome c oxidase subunit II